ncbi:MAG TPA: VOC family protein [Polyangiaceae bacterium]|nr:VOC family protein [Polyangiaceae bacterium]
MSTNLRFGFAVANVKDIAKAKTFYTEVLGLKVQREAPNFIQFEHFAIASDNPEATSPLELYWLVDDAEATRRELAARGASCSSVDAKPFGKLFTVKDPDGGERFLLEFASARPSKAL